MRLRALQEFDEYKKFVDEYGDVSKLPTREFIEPMEPGDEVTIDLEPGTVACLLLG